MSITFTLPDGKTHDAAMDAPPRIGEHVRIGLIEAEPESFICYRVKNVTWEFCPDSNVVTDAEVELELAP